MQDKKGRSMIRPAKRLRLGALCVSLMLLAACAAAEEVSQESPTGTASPAVEATQEETASREEETPREVDTVRMVLYAPSIYDWCWFAARDQGFFEDHDIEIAPDPLVVSTDADANRAMLSGEGDIAFATVGMLQAIPPGDEPAVQFIAGSGKAAYSFVGEAGGGTGFEALEGGTIALPPEGQPSGMVAAEAFNQRLGEGNWTPLHIGGGSSARLAALETGQADGAFMAAPYDAIVVSGNPKLEIIEYLDAAGAGYQIGAVMARSEWAEGNPDAVVRWLDAYIDGCNWVYDPANREEAIRVLAEGVDADPEAIELTYEAYIEGDLGGTTPPRDGGLDREALVNVAELLAEEGELEGDPEEVVDALVDLSYWEEAQAGS